MCIAVVFHDWQSQSSIFRKIVLYLLRCRSVSDDDAQWRYLLFASLFAYELAFLLSPSPTPPSATALSDFLFTDPASPSHNSILGLLWPNRVAYQHIRFLHSLFMLCSVAVSRVAPVLFPSPIQALDPQSLVTELNKLNGLAQAADAEGLL